MLPIAFSAFLSCERLQKIKAGSRPQYYRLAYHGNWYLMARKLEKERVATFALSRFKRMEGTGHTFTCPVSFSPEAYARQAFGIVGGEESVGAPRNGTIGG